VFLKYSGSGSLALILYSIQDFTSSPQILSRVIECAFSVCAASGPGISSGSVSALFP
jgi:hypothetical protein